MIDDAVRKSSVVDNVRFGICGILKNQKAEPDQDEPDYKGTNRQSKTVKEFIFLYINIF